MDRSESSVRCPTCGTGTVPVPVLYEAEFDHRVKQGVVVRCPDCLAGWTFWYGPRHRNP